MQFIQAPQNGLFTTIQNGAQGNGAAGADGILMAGNPFFGLLQDFLQQAQAQIAPQMAAQPQTEAQTQSLSQPQIQLQSQTQEQALTSKSFEALPVTLVQLTSDTQPVKPANLTLRSSDIASDQSLDISGILLLDGSFLGKENGLLERIAAEISAVHKDGNAAGVLFNLTPEQMTRLQSELAAAAKDEKMPELPDGFGLFIAVVPPKGANAFKDVGTKTDTLAAIKLLPFSSALESAEASEINQDVVASNTQLDDLLARVENRNFDDLLMIRSPEEKFSALLRNVAGMNAQAASTKGESSGHLVDFGKGDQTANTVAQGNTTPIADGLKAGNAQTPMGALEGIMLPEASLAESLGFDEGLLASSGLFGTSSSGSSSALAGLQNLTSPTTQAQHASLPHPSAALVAASLRQASSASGENRVITLQLDPPELGRVEVRMEFGHDKTLKTTVISEKPEAHLMLQRDAQILERAMQSSGFESEGSSLSFELAQDGQGFGQDGRHDGSRNNARAGQKDAESEIVLDTQMNWYVDPETGHMHYNILV